MELKGFHHLTAITAQAKNNHTFYTQTLGLRLVKKTVNQDDVSAYHLFYADGAGTPGTDITFFDWPARSERRGTNGIVRTGFRVDSEAALVFWDRRLTELQIPHTKIAKRDGRSCIDFDDPEGQRLTLAADALQLSPHPWEKSPVPPEYQIRGLGPITISVPNLEATDVVLTRVMQMRHAREYVGAATDGSSNNSSVHVYQMGGNGAASELHVAVEAQLAVGTTGAGGVHHVAFRVPTFEEYDQWNDRLQEFQIASSGPVDRFYFRSLYFREPNGILFELATDGPGFHADEPIESMGEGLALPPFLEPRRKQIEAGLKPL